MKPEEAHLVHECPVCGTIMEMRVFTDKKRLETLETCQCPACEFEEDPKFFLVQ